MKDIVRPTTGVAAFDYDDFWSRFDITPELLMKSAEIYWERAYAPYSRFRVGAVLLMSDGALIGGCNVENASYGMAICAERVAMSSAVAAGKRDPLAIAVYGGPGVFCSPCGACRQFLSEFNPHMQVLLLEDGEIRPYPLDVLLPKRFYIECEQ